MLSHEIRKSIKFNNRKVHEYFFRFHLVKRNHLSSMDLVVKRPGSSFLVKILDSILSRKERFPQIEKCGNIVGGSNFYIIHRLFDFFSKVYLCRITLFFCYKAYDTNVCIYTTAICLFRLCNGSTLLSSSFLGTSWKVV